jgi:eukaryotic-like serine/threonine-protein kinase
MATVVPSPAEQDLPVETRYRLDRRVGAGGMGQVWQATDLLLNRQVAVKRLGPASARDQAGLARFRAEARHAGSLSHPGIARVYDYWEGDLPGGPCLVMELVDGPSLASVLDDGPLNPARTMDLVAQAARALAAAHVAGLVHRDIKPGNLLVSRTGQVKITDFGIAHAVGSAPITRPGTLIGTPAYLAPEQAIGEPATPAADLYALGIVAYRCLTGTLPFDGPPLAVAIAHQERAMPALPRSVPAGVAALVADLTAKDPRARPASAVEVARRASQLHAVLTDPAPAPVPAGGRRPGRARHRRPAYATLAAAVTAITGASWFLTGTHGTAPVHAQSRPPAASHSLSPGHGSHAAPGTAPVRVTGTSGGRGAPGQAHRSTARHGSLAATATEPRATRRVSASAAPAPASTPAGAATGTSTGAPTASQAPTPAGSSSPAAAPTPTGSPIPTGSPGSGGPSGPIPASPPATGMTGAALR